MLFYFFFLMTKIYLQETLEKMRERIEVTTGNFDSPDVPIQSRMEELKISDS